MDRLLQDKVGIPYRLGPIPTCGPQSPKPLYNQERLSPNRRVLMRLSVAACKFARNNFASFRQTSPPPRVTRRDRPGRLMKNGQTVVTTPKSPTPVASMPRPERPQRHPWPASYVNPQDVLWLDAMLFGTPRNSRIRRALEDPFLELAQYRLDHADLIGN